MLEHYETMPRPAGAVNHGVDAYLPFHVYTLPCSLIPMLARPCLACLPALLYPLHMTQRATARRRLLSTLPDLPPACRSSHMRSPPRSYRRRPPPLPHTLAPTPRGIAHTSCHTPQAIARCAAATATATRCARTPASQTRPSAPTSRTRSHRRTCDANAARYLHSQQRACGRCTTGRLARHALNEELWVDLRGGVDHKLDPLLCAVGHEAAHAVGGLAVARRAALVPLQAHGGAVRPAQQHPAMFECVCRQGPSMA
jgi:hypothetical protein